MNSIAVKNTKSPVIFDREKKSLKNNISIENNVQSVMNITLLIVLNGLHNLNWYTSMINVVNSTQTVLICSCPNIIRGPKTIDNKTIV